MRFIKDPQAVLDYVFDWSSWLPSGDSITGHTITAETGLTVDASSITGGGTTVTTWLSGGTAGESYDVTCHVTTSDGREDDRTITIMVKER